MFTYLIFEIIAVCIAIVATIFLMIHIIKYRTVWTIIRKRGIYMSVIAIVFAGTIGFISHKTYAPDFAMPMFMHSDAPGGIPPNLPFLSIFNFFTHIDRFERVVNISANPSEVPAEPQKPDDDGIVQISLETQEVISEIAPGIYQNYWTYNKQVPGPMLRVREGDTVDITLTNNKTSLHNHNIDLHAVNGPGGGAVLTNVAPGETKTFRFKASNPGLYVYHCAMPNVSNHNSHGQYGLIMVDPQNASTALQKVDREFYVMQGEFYTTGGIGKRGLMRFDSEGLLNGTPTYVVFNGKIESTPRLKAHVGERVRIYVGNGGVNLISSFHVIGEVFDIVYPEAAIGEGSTLFKNVQTTAVLPGGASIVEFTVDVPGKYLLVDHALARMNKGAWAVLEVIGDESPDLFSSVNTSH